MEKELKKIWKEEFIVNWFDADLNGNMKPSSICNCLQEVAGRHATHFGFGFYDAKAKNQVWVIVGLMVKMLKYPTWWDKIYVETWPKKIDRILAFRDFRILNEKEEVIGAATSSWMLIDLDTRRPQPVDLVKHALHLATRQDVLDQDPPMIRKSDVLQENGTHQVQYTELDFNGHVNNTRYIDWCLSAFSITHHKKYKLDTLLINFLSEVTGEDQIKINSANKEELTYVIEGISRSREKPVFRAELSWRNK